MMVCCQLWLCVFISAASLEFDSLFASFRGEPWRIWEIVGLEIWMTGADGQAEIGDG